MRWTIVLVTVLMAFLTTVEPVSAQLRYSIGLELEHSPLVNVERRVDVDTAGVIAINDTLTFKAPANDSISLSSLQIGAPSYFTAVRQSFYLMDGDMWKSLSYRALSLNYTGLRFYEVELPSRITLQGEAILTVKASYLSVNQVSLSGGYYSALVPLYPAVIYNITSYKFNMTLPTDSTLKTIVSNMTFTNSTAKGIWALYTNASNLSPVRYENVTVKFTPSSSDAYLIDLELLQRNIAVFQGSLTIDDKYILVNRGKLLSSFELRLPRDAYGIKAFDSVGAISATHQLIQENETYVQLLVAPRTTVRQNDRWILTVEYSIPGSGTIRNDGDKYAMSIQTIGSQFYFRNVALIVALPEGGSFESSTPQPVSVIQASQYIQKATFESGSLVPHGQSSLTVNYILPITWAVVRPLQWILVAALAVGLVYVLRRRKPKVETKPVTTRRTELDSLLEIYKERIALLVELEELDHNLDRKTVSREHFDRRTAEISRRQQEILRNVGHLEDQLEASKPSIADRLQAIKNAEVDLERASTDLRNLDTRFRAKRISRADYAQKHREALKRLGQARRRIEQVITSLEAGS